MTFLKKPLALTQNFSRANKFSVRARLRTPGLEASFNYCKLMSFVNFDITFSVTESNRF